MRSRCRAAWPKLSIVVLSLCAACACAETSGSQQKAPEPPPPKPLAGAELVAGYKGWTRVNPQPARFHLMDASDCAVPLGAAAARTRGADSPHLEKFINVFVNEAGRSAMLGKKRPRFPEGTLIVKEKLLARDASEPELLTVMLKHARGYDPEGGDWEYLVLDGRGQQVRARGKLETCRACHQAYPETDFVARSYLPYGLYKDLK